MKGQNPQLAWLPQALVYPKLIFTPLYNFHLFFFPSLELPYVVLHRSGFIARWLMAFWRGTRCPEQTLELHNPVSPLLSPSGMKLRGFVSRKHTQGAPKAQMKPQGHEIQWSSRE